MYMIIINKSSFDALTHIYDKIRNACTIYTYIRYIVLLYFNLIFSIIIIHTVYLLYYNIKQ